eukprot:2234253-Rhodomonas_salina.1
MEQGTRKGGCLTTPSPTLLREVESCQASAFFSDRKWGSLMPPVDTMSCCMARPQLVLVVDHSDSGQIATRTSHLGHSR